MLEPPFLMQTIINSTQQPKVDVSLNGETFVLGFLKSVNIFLKRKQHCKCLFIQLECKAVKVIISTSQVRRHY